jgi:hypothetical protein
MTKSSQWRNRKSKRRKTFAFAREPQIRDEGLYRHSLELQGPPPKATLDNLSYALAFTALAIEITPVTFETSASTLGRI